MGQLEKQFVCQVIDSNFPNDGEYTTTFERRVGELLDVPYVVAVTSGTAAIFLGLAACNVGPGDEVIVPDITFIATANAVTLTGARPILVDVCLDSFNIDPERVEAAITDRTKAIIPVHVSGRSANMPPLLEIARKYHLHVVEDAAEAFGSKFNGQALGTFGEVGCFSFSPNKTITTGQGGVVVTREAALHRRLRELKDQGRPFPGMRGGDEHVSVGYNFKLTNIQAAIGLAQLEDFSSRQNHLREMFCFYRECLAGAPQVRLPGFNIEGGECPQWVDIFVDNRDDLHDYLLAQNVSTRKLWFPLHTQLPYRLGDEKFPASLEVSRKGLWLPSSLSLTKQEIRMVCDLVREWAERTSA